MGKPVMELHNKFVDTILVCFLIQFVVPRSIKPFMNACIFKESEHAGIPPSGQCCHIVEGPHLKSGNKATRNPSTPLELVGSKEGLEARALVGTICGMVLVPHLN